MAANSKMFEETATSEDNKEGDQQEREKKDGEALEEKARAEDEAKKAAKEAAVGGARDVFCFVCLHPGGPRHRHSHNQSQTTIHPPPHSNSIHI